MITPHCGDRRAEFPCAFDFFGIVFRRDNRDIQSSNPLVATKGIHGAYRLGYSEGMLQQTGGALNNTIPLLLPLLLLLEPVRDFASFAVYSVTVISDYDYPDEHIHGTVRSGGGQQLRNAKEQEHGSALPEAKREQTAIRDSQLVCPNTFQSRDA